MPQALAPTRVGRGVHSLVVTPALFCPYVPFTSSSSNAGIVSLFLWSLGPSTFGDRF